MPRFYFNVISGAATVADLEGTELVSLEDARLEAVQDARALMSQAVLSGRDISGRKIHICDEEGAVLLVVPFIETIKRSE
ncbi:DUF6894 family protein [Rhizobium etli]|uniref:DUF6894 domain-containing protein n=1 Tax=Rhizobium etli TaxID=29449 RepID=A0A7W7EFF1_RHIET|nr:hypothetical protein [Rhizobium etli]MBB4481369.1 hypothetical protein [Rhizobium etli]MBB4537018.1 hypothetical protein [Rhizobium etli]